MLTPKYSLCAEVISVDSSSNNVSATNILESVGVLTFPVLIPKLSAMVVLEKDSEDPPIHEVKVSARLDNKPLHETKFDLDFKSFNIGRSILNINGLLLPGPGRLYFDFSVDNSIVDTFSILVKQSTIEEMKAPPIVLMVPPKP